MSATSLIQRFERNAAGRDFVVGDIHGYFDAVRALLARVEFDESCDRLFSVGDLVDRGPQCREVLDWLRKPWFHPVRGNHEQMAIDHVVGFRNDEAYRKHGGGWFLELDASEQAAFAIAFCELPILAELETAHGTIGIVHADPVDSDWKNLCERIGDDLAQLRAMWSRDRIRSGDESWVAGVGAVIVGHSVVPEPRRLGNVLYIDTGAYKGRALTMVELPSTAPTFPTFHVHPMTQAEAA